MNINTIAKNFFGGLFFKGALFCTVISVIVMTGVL